MDEHAPSAFGEVVITQRYDVPEGSIATKPRLWGMFYSIIQFFQVSLQLIHDFRALFSWNL